MSNPENPRLDEVWKYAWDKLREHNLSGWYMGWDNGKNRYGYCDFRRKRISISRLLAAAMPIEETKDTVLHEIAHALAGPNHGHDKVWKEICIRIGAKPRRCWDGANNPLGYRYEAGCPNYCWRRQYHRPPRNGYVCACGRYEVVTDKETGKRWYWKAVDREYQQEPYEYTPPSGVTKIHPGFVGIHRKFIKTELKPGEQPPRYEDREVIKLDPPVTLQAVESEPV